MEDWKDKFLKNNKFYETYNGILYCQDNRIVLKQFHNDSIDLVVTSPPYDNLRTYNMDIDKQWNFEVFKEIANELSRVLKPGGVIVWVVNDATINGSETGTSFRQALYFKDECGLNIHDTMIYEKLGFPNPSSNRYHQIFEYMFIFSKGKPKTFNPIIDRKNKYLESKGKVTYRTKNGILKERKKHKRKNMVKDLIFGNMQLVVDAVKKIKLHISIQQHFQNN